MRIGDTMFVHGGVTQQGQQITVITVITTPLPFIQITVITTPLPFIQNGAKSGFEMCFCYRIPAPWVPGVPTKTRHESRIQKFKPHLVYRPALCSGRARISLLGRVRRRAARLAVAVNNTAGPLAYRPRPFQARLPRRPRRSILHLAACTGGHTVLLHSNQPATHANDEARVVLCWPWHQFIALPSSVTPVLLLPFCSLATLLLALCCVHPRVSTNEALCYSFALTDSTHMLVLVLVAAL